MKQKSKLNCPLCGASNRCAVAKGDNPASCWCMSAPIDASNRQAALQKNPNACLCPRCATAATSDNKEKNI